MAARLNPRHTDMVRQKIQASVLIDKLHKCVEGELKMDRNQLTAAIALLDRSVPKLQQIQHSGDENNPVQIVNQYKWDE
jgi:hypothetical protein